MRLIINLLPPHKKAELRSAFMFSFLQTMLIIVLAGACVASFSLLSVRLIMNKNLSDVSRQNSPETQEFKAVSETIKAMNTHMKRLDQLNGEFNDWSKLMLAIESDIPSGIAVERLDVSAAGAVTINGLGATRDDVLALRANLEKDPAFKEVKSPLSNILQRTEVKFEFTMAYVDFRAPASFTATTAKKKGAK